MRDKYNEQLQLLRKALVEMGCLCEEAISLAIQALVSEEDLSDKVFDADAGIDKKEREIESMCLKLLLEQQPMASDLREISAALKMISDMERIGDQASDIAEITRYLISHPDGGEDGLKAMAGEAIGMVTDSVDSFVRRDLTLARRVIAYDDVVDGWFARIRAEVIAHISDGGAEGEYWVDILMVAKYLERIADHATNIGEWVEYSLTGRRSKNGVFPQGPDVL